MYGVSEILFFLPSFLKTMVNFFVFLWDVKILSTDPETTVRGSQTSLLFMVHRILTMSPTEVWFLDVSKLLVYK